jgi:hypothetical protein
MKCESYLINNIIMILINLIELLFEINWCFNSMKFDWMSQFLVPDQFYVESSILNQIIVIFCQLFQKLYLNLMYHTYILCFSIQTKFVVNRMIKSWRLLVFKTPISPILLNYIIKLCWCFKNICLTWIEGYFDGPIPLGRRNRNLGIFVSQSSLTN